MEETASVYVHPIGSTLSGMQVIKADRMNSCLVVGTRWDGKIQLLEYNTQSKKFKESKTPNVTLSESIPLMGLAISKNKVYSSFEDENRETKIVEIDLENDDEPTIIGTYSRPINRLLMLDENNLCAFSWDNSCMVWDLRNRGKQPAQNFKLPLKVTDVKLSDQCVIGILNGEKLFRLNRDSPSSKNCVVFEVKKAVSTYPASLTSIGLDPYDDTNFCLGNLEGRILKCKYDAAKGESEAKDFWRSHYFPSPKIVFPVSSVIFHPTEKNFVITGGTDGRVFSHDLSVNMDRSNKLEIGDDMTPITHLETNESGSYLFVAKGYGWRHSNEKMFSKADQAKIMAVELLPEEDF